MIDKPRNDSYIIKEPGRINAEAILPEPSPLDLLNNNHEGLYIKDLELPTPQLLSVMAEHIKASSIRLDGSNITELPLHMQAVRSNHLMPLSEHKIKETNLPALTKEELNRVKNKINYRASFQNIKQHFTASDQTLKSTRGLRVTIGYRLTRYLAMIRGDVMMGESMTERMHAEGINASKWDIPLRDYRSKCFPIPGTQGIISVLMEATEDKTLTYSYKTGTHTAGKTTGMSYLPPPLPDYFFKVPEREIPDLRAAGYTPEDYDPYDDAGINRFCMIYSFLSEHLGICRNDVLHAQVMTALLNPAMVRMAWPSGGELEVYEEGILLPRVEEYLAKYSTIKTVRWLQDTMDLTYMEAEDLVETAKNFSAKLHRYDPVQERTTMLNRLERLGDDCSEAAMVTTELNTLKARSTILGLTDNNNQDKMDEGEAVAGVLEEAHQQKRLGTGKKESFDND